jgi:hypothetical protein
MEQRCPDVVWPVIQRQEKAILYEWWIANCPPHPDQHEIAHILEGEVTLWRPAYTVRGKAVSAELREQWITELAEAKSAFEASR